MKNLITILLILALLFILSPITPIQAATGVIDRQVITGVDDCEVYWTGSNWFWKPSGPGSSAGHLSNAVDKIETGMRFRSITIPEDTVITRAYLTFTCHTPTSGTRVKTIIEGEATNDAKAFSSLSNFEGRNRTRADIDWDDIIPWTLNSPYQSPDIKTVIQEIVNRSGWDSGNDIVLFWGDDGSTHADGCYRAQYTYEGGNTAKSAKLHIEYGYTEGAPEDLEELIEDLDELAYTLDTQVKTLISQASGLSIATAELQGTTSVLSHNLTSLEEKLNTISSELSGRLNTMETTIGNKLTAIENKLSILETNIQTLETREEASQRLLGVEGRLTNLEEKSAITFLDWISLIILIILGIAILTRRRRRTYEK